MSDWKPKRAKTNESRTLSVVPFWAKPRDEGTTWSCLACTYTNKPLSLVCGICREVRQPDPLVSLPLAATSRRPISPSPSPAPAPSPSPPSLPSASSPSPPLPSLATPLTKSKPTSPPALPPPTVPRQSSPSASSPSSLTSPALPIQGGASSTAPAPAPAPATSKVFGLFSKEPAAPSASTTLTRAMEKAKPANAPEWVAVVRSVYEPHAHGSDPNALPNWGGLMTTIKKPPKYAELALDKSAYMPAYEPLFQDDTRPPGSGDAPYIDPIRRPSFGGGRSALGHSLATDTSTEASTEATTTTTTTTIPTTAPITIIASTTIIASVATTTTTTSSTTTTTTTTATIVASSDFISSRLIGERLPFRLSNFQLLLRAALAGGLLAAEDAATVSTFFDLSLDAQLLYSNLSLYLGPWFRTDSYNFDRSLPFGDLDKAQCVRELVDQGLASALLPDVPGSTLADHLHIDLSLVDLCCLMSALTERDLDPLFSTGGKGNNWNNGKRRNSLGGSTQSRIERESSAGVSSSTKVQRLHSCLMKVLEGPQRRHSLGVSGNFRASLSSALGVCLRLSPGPLGVFQRASRLVFIQWGCLPEESRGLLDTDLERWRNGAAQEVTSPLDALALQNLYTVERLLQRADDMEKAVRVGDAETALCVLQEASSALVDDRRTGRLRAAWVAARITMRGVTLLEKQSDPSVVVSYLEILLSVPERFIGSWHRSLAWERYCKVLKVCRRPHSSIAQSKQALTQPCLQGLARVGLQHRLISLCKAHGQESIESQLLPAPEKTLLAGRVVMAATGKKKERKSWVLPRGGLTSSVEHWVLMWYHHNEGWDGCHAENMLWLTLLNLLFIDILLPAAEADSGFADHPLTLLGACMVSSCCGEPASPVPLADAAASEAPSEEEGADAKEQCCALCEKKCEYTSSFYRLPGIALQVDARVKSVRAGCASEILEAAWVQYSGQQVLFINWQRHPMARLQLIAGAVGGAVLGALVEAALKTQVYEAVTCGGFPDLTLWKPDGSAVKFCEVKGPGDKLSDKQRYVLDMLLTAGADAEVCYVKAEHARSQ